MRWRRIRYFLLSMVLVVYVVLTGCDLPSKTDYFAYQRGSYTAGVRGEWCRTSGDGYEAAETDFAPGVSGTEETWRFAATVTVTQSDDGGTPAVSVTFSEPDALEGITVSRQNGVVKVSLGGMVLSDAQHGGVYDGLCRIVDVMLVPASVVSAHSAEEGMIIVKVTSEQGQGEFIFAEDVLLPRRIVWSTDAWRLNMCVDEIRST